MARIEYNAITITLDIPDVVINDTIIKRKAELFTLTYNQTAKALSLNWIVKHYSNDNGAYGEYIPYLIANKSKESVADNLVIVNANTGEILQPDAEGNYPDEIETIGQYDWFNRLGEYQPINVHNLIKSYGMTADWQNIK